MNLIHYINRIKPIYFGIIVIILYSISVAVGMHYHVMWRDELEWFLRRKYQPFFSEGDPCYMIYNSLLYAFLLIYPSEWMFQLSHLLIVISAVFFMIFCSPFNNLEKLLLAFGYYFLYEYGVISRYYGFIVLLVFSICYLLGKVKRNYTIIVVLLLILAEHNPSATIFAASLSGYLILDTYNKIKGGKISYKNNRDLILATCLFIIGWISVFVLFYLYLFKAYAIAIYKGGTPPLFTVVNSIWNSYVPIPDISQKVRFWWTNIIPFPVAYPTNYHFSLNDFTWEYALAFILSTAIITIVISKFRKNPTLLIIFILNTAVYAVFMQAALKVYTTRYLGLLFIVFVYCYWIYLSADKNCHIKIINRGVEFLNKGILAKFLSYFEKLFKPMTYLILISGVVASSLALSKEIKYKFSLSQEAATYIEWSGLQNTHALVGYPDYAAQCISAHLDKQIFYPQIGVKSYYSGCLNKNFKQSLPLSEVFDSCIKLSDEENKKVLLILNFPIMADSEHILAGPAMINPNSSIQLLQSITGEVINPDEQFWLYEVCKVP